MGILTPITFEWESFIIKKKEFGNFFACDLLCLLYNQNGGPNSHNNSGRWLPHSVTGTSNQFYSGYCHISNPCETKVQGQLAEGQL